MATTITEPEIMAFLLLVESGAVKLTPVDEPQDVYAGNVDYTGSNGWEVTIFNDANEWDYIDYLRTEDGRECDYDDICTAMPLVDDYQPSDDIAWKCYRIPGYCTFRCVTCGSLLDKPQRKAPYLCPACK